MSQPAPNTSLSLSARLLCYTGPPSVILFTSLASPKTGLFTPLTFLPTAWFYRKWKQLNKANPSRRGELQPLVWTFALTGTLGLTGVALAQFVIIKVISKTLFSPSMRKDFWPEWARSTVAGLTTSQIAHRSELASSWQNWVLNGAFAFLGAGIFEESLKYLPIVYAGRRSKKQKDAKPRDRAYIDYAITGALSFGVIETIGFLYSAIESGDQTGLALAFTIFERVAVGQLAHLSVATLTALRAIRRDYYGDRLSLWEVVGPAALLHGTADFVAFSASSLEGNPGWIHPTSLRITGAMIALYASLVGTAMWNVRQELKGLDARDHAGEAVEETSTEK